MKIARDDEWHSIPIDALDIDLINRLFEVPPALEEELLRHARGVVRLAVIVSRSDSTRTLLQPSEKRLLQTIRSIAPCLFDDPKDLSVLPAD